MAFPTNLDTFTTKTDGVSDVLAADINNLQIAVLGLETKLGITNSTDVNSIDSKLRTGTGVVATSATTATTATNVTNVTTSQVLTATASATVGAVGTYAFLSRTTGATDAPGATVAGSSLRYAGGLSSGSGPLNGGISSTSPSGTWRVMGQISYATDPCSFPIQTTGLYGTLCLRIS